MNFKIQLQRRRQPSTLLKLSAKTTALTLNFSQKEKHTKISKNKKTLFQHKFFKFSELIEELNFQLLADLDKRNSKKKTFAYNSKSIKQKLRYSHVSKIYKNSVYIHSVSVSMQIKNCKQTGMKEKIHFFFNNKICQLNK